MRGIDLPPMRKAVPAFAALIILAACGDHIVDPALPASAARFDPPPAYSRWWDMTQACSGIRKDLGELQWYRSAAPTIRLNGKEVTAYWSLGSKRIVVVDAYRLNGSVIRHEMLHSLIRQEGHPREYFMEKCGGVVHCEGDCIEPAAPYVPLPIVQSDHLQTSLSIDPENPGATFEDGLFSVTVTATNPADHAVRVNLTPHFPGNSLYTFTINITGTPTRSVRPIDDAAFTFRARETKRHVFDLKVDPSGRMGPQPGRYLITGGYDRTFGPAVEVTIR